MKFRKISIIIGMCIAFTACSCKNTNNTERETDKETSNFAADEKQTTIKEEVTDDVETYIPNGKTPNQIIDIILGNGKFIFVDMDYSGEQKTLLEYDSLKAQEAELDEGLRGTYRVVDLNADGYNEVIIDVIQDEVLILHYEEECVYGFEYPLRGISQISYKGVISGSSSAFATSYSMIKFNRDSLVEEEIALYQEGITDGEESKYYLAGKEVSEEEYLEYISGEIFQGEVPYWSEYKLLLETK